MFTIKFYTQDNGGAICKFISSCHFDVYERENGIFTVSAYDQKTGDGVDFHLKAGGGIENGRQYYDVAYIENQSGKTIHTVRPPN